MSHDPAARRRAAHERQERLLAEQRQLAEAHRRPRPPEQIGTPLRDAAVDPRPGDHLAPVNAGAPGPVGDPHGPHVVSPEVDGPPLGAA